MLNDYKEIYIKKANEILDWESLSVSSLCDLYLMSSSYFKNCYLSAIICNYWNLMEKNYYAQDFKIATPEDCYNWTVSGILRALEKHSWTDKTSILYEDPKGPEKAISVCIATDRAAFYRNSNQLKRKLNYFKCYLDDEQEECISDAFETDSLNKIAVNSIIRQLIDDELYEYAIVLFILLDTNPYILDKICINELLHEIEKISTIYIIGRFKKYEIKDFEKFKNSIYKLKSMSYYKLKKLITELVCYLHEYYMSGDLLC